jgi:hypothetical protein
MYNDFDEQYPFCSAEIKQNVEQAAASSLLPRLDRLPAASVYLTPRPAHSRLRLLTFAVALAINSS